MTIRFPFSITQVAENVVEINEGDNGIKFPEVTKINFDEKVPMTDRQKDIIHDVAYEAIRTEYVRQLIEVC